MILLIVVLGLLCNIYIYIYIYRTETNHQIYKTWADVPTSGGRKEKPDSPTFNDTSMKGWKIGLIVGSVLLGVGIIAYLLYFYYCKPRRRRSPPPNKPKVDENISLLTRIN